MRLIVLPASPNTKSGYGLVVKQDIAFLNISKEDIVLFFSFDKPIKDQSNYLYLKRFDRKNYRRLINLIMGRTTSAPLSKDIKKALIDYNLREIDEIYCGDTYLYDPLKKIFPSKKMLVRFHNLYSRTKIREEIFNYPTEPIFKLFLRFYNNVENRIFRDFFCTPVFLLKEDYLYYKSIINQNCILKEFNFKPSKKLIKPQKEINKLVYFGGVNMHKKKSIEYMLLNIFPKIKLINPLIELHLFGKGTEIYKLKYKDVFAHGFYQGKGFPFNGEAIFINPDLIGGGIKIKLANYFENGIPFISTPFGYDGYSNALLKKNFFEVAEFENWPEVIFYMFKRINSQVISYNNISSI